MAKTVMVIDDSATLRMVVSDTLKNSGYETIEANDGREALQKLTGQRVHLIVCDVHMPNMDGITFVKELKEMPRYKFTPVLMLTTESQERKKQEGKDVGVKAWIIKPFKPEQILSAVEKLILP
jgi:two-component system chemotaxis response regulator CheY